MSWVELARRRRIGTRRLAVIAIAAVVIAAVGAGGFRWWRYARDHVSTDDAYVAAHISPVSARIAGTSSND